MYSKVIQLYVYIYSFFFRFFSLIGNYRILSSVPCAIQLVLVSYLFYIQQCVYVHPNLLIYHFPSCFPFGATQFYIQHETHLCQCIYMCESESLCIN